ncbi:cysteine-rich CWC family protein [Paenibacillus sp. NEAU-GSW1]|uniref:cysteine-rich CWC family protein n=1 Tax=Paenibacillus sp. NEAU-GSW1 TaxID=2682486 RepID=UPI0012E22A7E|nr:hypothetical protein [Paenibacillus sp. NEAU-GSW1]
MKCPICGENHVCSYEEAGLSETCWCMNEHFSKQLLGQVPESEKGLSCICKKCVERSR